ncbi:TPA: extracellular solute-binding protein [Candidatus Bipolaricaulota bacterium]|nr:extracellular solute-binding protein [Candidatus Bipolaricaulota bacterium]
MLRRIFTVGLLVVILTFVVFGQQRPFEGVTITVFTQTPPFIAKPVEMFKAEWEAKTGGKVELITAPWGELYTKMMASLTLGTGTFDLLLHPAAWQPDFVPFLVPLDGSFDPEVNVFTDARLNWNDILPVYRERIASWAGVVYSVPLDGDLHIAYYRKDCIENPEYQAAFKAKYGYDLRPPKTWQEYRDIAEFFTLNPETGKLEGWDWDGDGEPEWGFVEAMRKAGQADWFFLSRVAAWVADPDRPGAMFFDPDTMEPLINSPGHKEALKLWKEMVQFGVPGILGFDSGEIRFQYAAGKACLAMDWADIGIIADTDPASVVKGKVGYMILPGTTKVWNYKTGEWEEKFNQAPFLAFGGWLGSVAKNRPRENIIAAYDFLSFLSSPEKSLISVTTPATGFNPYRASHATPAAFRWWKAFGMVDPEAYIGIYTDSIAHENVQVDLRIPGTARYYEAMETAVVRVLAGELDPEEALDQVAKEWDRITDELGRENQLKAYRAMLGLP